LSGVIDQRRRAAGADGFYPTRCRPVQRYRQYRTAAVEEASTLGFGWRHTLDHHITFTEGHILWRDHENVTLRLPLPDRTMPASCNPLAGARAWCDKEDNTFVLSAPSLKGWLMHVVREPDGTQGRVSGFSASGDAGKSSMRARYPSGCSTLRGWRCISVTANTPGGHA
jgi:hypothetical protein